MLLWINGPFGGGKTQTAHEIARRLPGSVVCDPEHVGFGLHRTLPPRLRHDFQDLPAWRRGVFEMLDLTLSSGPETVIAPMTLIHSGYFDETIGRLRDRGHDVRHFALLARRETVVRRLRERGAGALLRIVRGKGGSLRGETFAMAKLDECLDRLVRPEFAEHLWTDHLEVAEVADRIAASAGLTLAPNRDGRLRGRLRRAVVGYRHIRFD